MNNRSDNLNISEELALLKQNVFKQLRDHNIRIKHNFFDLSFNPANWIITFPFNFYNLLKDANLDHIRKIAVMNALYGYYFLSEDNVLDEYGIPGNEFNLLIQKFCVAHALRNLSVGQMLAYSGKTIYQYINNYENMYYHAVLTEKKLRNVTLTAANLKLIGLKAIPICIPFAAVCLKFNCVKYITQCEKLVINYHIAHQLYDDLSDIYVDIDKPDNSWLLKTIYEQVGTELLSSEQIAQFFEYTDFDLLIIRIIKKYLQRTMRYAKRMDFIQFIEHVKYLNHLADGYQRIKS